MPKKRSTLSQKTGIKKVDSGPIWKGPEKDGVTQSLISRFLSCRERFRILTIEGLKGEDRFSKALEYGNMWHLCEENLADHKDWKEPLTNYCASLCSKYQEDQFEIQKWFEVCKTQFPVYCEFWEKHGDVKNRTPILQEETFLIPYTLPSGRVVILRGKFDSVDLIGKGKSAGIYLQENKSKGDIDEEKIRRQMESGFDLQTMMYMIALCEYFKDCQTPIKGVRYNVVRRPLSGGKGTIKQGEGTKGSKCNLKQCRDAPVRGCVKCGGTGRFGRKPPEKIEDFFNRLKKDYLEKEPEYFFMRWKIDISREDIDRFRRDSFDPILEQLCCWYDSLVIPSNLEKRSIRIMEPACLHYRFPSGVYNPVAEGRETEYDEYLRTGNTVGLQKVKTLFPELEE